MKLATIEIQPNVWTDFRILRITPFTSRLSKSRAEVRCISKQIAPTTSVFPDRRYALVMSPSISWTPTWGEIGTSTYWRCLLCGLTSRQRGGGDDNASKGKRVHLAARRWQVHYVDYLLLICGRLCWGVTLIECPLDCLTGYRSGDRLGLNVIIDFPDITWPYGADGCIKRMRLVYVVAFLKLCGSISGRIIYVIFWYAKTCALY